MKQPTEADIEWVEPAIPEELTLLIEQLAREVHETWMQGRLNEGWTWGAVRNDALKQHPCLVPYDELSENEKDYDRRTATTTLKTLIKLGWRIERVDKTEGKGTVPMGEK